MKKIFTLTLMMLAAMSGYAQTNLFDAADCDANGWLWFDSQEKIDKYVGLCDEENYSVNTNGKPIQMAYAWQSPDYPETTANPDYVGTDKAGYMEGEEKYTPGEALTGAILLPKASGSSILGSPDGGCLILNLPSCSFIGLYMSSEGTYLGRTLMITPGFKMSEDDKEGEEQWTGKTKAILSKATRFDALHSAGQWKWETAATDHGRTNGDLNFVSNNAVYFSFQNCNNSPVFIHGIKVLLGNSAGINDINATKNGKAEYFTLDGRRVEQTVHGLTIVRQNGKVRKVLK